MAGRMSVIAQRFTIIYFIFGDIQMTVKSLRDYADEWEKIPWKQFQAILSRLQRRIHKAAIKNDNTNVKRLQRLLLTSQSSKYLAVKNVVEFQQNHNVFKGNCTKSINAKQKLNVVKYLNRVMIFRSDFDKHNVSSNSKDIRLIEQIQKKALQDLFYYSLLPLDKAYRLSSNEYSKIPASVKYIQSKIETHLRTQNPKQMTKILIFDIDECFDTFSIKTFLKAVTLPASYLKAFKYLLKKDVSQFSDNQSNVKRKNITDIVSPLLIKILFFDVEKIRMDTLTQIRKSSLTIQDGCKIVFIVDKQQCEFNIRKEMISLLLARGLGTEKIKFSVISSTQGFDFLEWHLKMQQKNTKLIASPTKNSRKEIVKRIKSIMRNPKYNLENRLKKGKLIHKKWMGYYSTCNKLQTHKWQISQWLYKYIKNHTNYSRIDTINQVRNFVSLYR